MSRISYLSELLSSVFARQDASDHGVHHGSFSDLCDSVLSHQGESSGNRFARSLLQKFNEASQDEQLEFFKMLASRFDIDAERAVQAAQAYASNRSADKLSALMDTVEPTRQELFRRLNRVPGATNDLVRMRALLLRACQLDPDLRRIDLDFQHLFRSWFNRGFLVLREIDWHTPANILEKVIEYEAVHAINSWSALRNRLKPCDRRCFAFFHPAMLDEPLIFVEVALTVDTPGTIKEVLKTDRSIVQEHEARTAVFYSISNCQQGLAGVSFGNFLIKQVATELSISVPGLKTFRTLSPVPGFIKWVNTQLASFPQKHASVEVDNRQEHNKLPLQSLKLAQQVAGSTEFVFSDEDNVLLQKLVAYYLTQVRREDQQSFDAVARFHLGNGASLDAVLPGADVYKKGLSQSAGVMVSYLYDLDKVAGNHELYANERHIIASDSVMALLEPERRKRKLA
ncbi:MAG: malonyl-CoA decarboxylase family protein [Granulosicoccus sp.]